MQAIPENIPDLEESILETITKKQESSIFSRTLAKTKHLRRLSLATGLATVLTSCDSTYYLQKEPLGGLYWITESTHRSLKECESAKRKADRAEPSYLFRCDMLGLPL